MSEKEVVYFISNFLPLVILFGFWVYIIKKGSFKKSIDSQKEALLDQKEILTVLKEIRDSLKNKEVK